MFQLGVRGPIRWARNGEVELAYEVFGPPTDHPLLLLTGAGAQMVMWPDDFCAALTERGFQVARMDFRDTGLSTHLTRSDVAYTLRDLTGDVVAVLDDLDWPTAHLFGWSLGGGIAQATATYHPDRVRTLISMSSGPVIRPWITGPRLRTALKTFRAMRRESKNRDDEGQRWVDTVKIAGSPAYPLDEEHWREAGRRAFDHGLNPQGDLRLGRAMLVAGDRRRELAGITAPTLVLHGEADTVVIPRGGRETAKAIPGARLVTYPGWGHDLPRELWPAILDEVQAHTAGRTS